MSVRPGAYADADEVTAAFEEIRSKLANIQGGWFVARTIEGINLALNCIQARHIADGAVTGSKVASGTLTAANFRATGAGSGFNTDEVDGFHASEIGCLGVHSREIEKDDLNEYYGTGDSDLGWMRITLTPSNFGRTSFPDPDTDPWAVVADIDAFLVTATGDERDDDDRSFLCAPRVAGVVVEEKTTSSLTIVIATEYDSAFWTPDAYRDTATLTVALVKKAS